MNQLTPLENSIALREEGRFADAIATIERNRDAFDQPSMLLALITAYCAAVQNGEPIQAKMYAREIQKREPLLTELGDSFL